MFRLRIGFVLLSATALFASDGPMDPPSRVARLNLINGPVSFQPAGVDDWIAAVPNRPIVTGDRLWVDDNARAELHIGSIAVRLDRLSSFDLLNLDDSNLQIRMPQGLMVIRVRRLDPSETIEIDTPQGAVSLVRPGEYRIEVRDDGSASRVLTRDGEAEITGGQEPFALHRGQATTITGTDNLRYDLDEAPAPDEFDNWCMDRDRREDASQSARYVDRDMIGYEDLDANGTWREESGYGAVWVPRTVPAGWAPYRYGHWVWLDPWGWTWVDDAPWGFAPFHYGRWAYLGGGWAWVPGARMARPVYAPALVAFVGGSHFSISVGVGGGPVGWFPLGPREAYYPAYRVSPAYVRNVNVTHVTNINVTNVNVTNVRYVNQTVPGAMTVVPAQTFSNAGSVQRVAVPVSIRDASAAKVNAMAPQVVPRQASVIGVGRASAPPPAAVMRRQVFARATPPPAPVPFVQRQQVLNANPGRPIDVQTMRTMQQSAPQRTYIRTAPVPMGRMESNPNVAQPAAPVRQEFPRRVDTPAASTPPPARVQEFPRRVDTPPVNTPPAPRQEFPRRVEQPANTPPVNTPPAPRQEFPRRVEQPANTPPAPRQEFPRRVEQPANTPSPPAPRIQEVPRRVEQPAYTPPPRQETPRRVEQPANTPPPQVIRQSTPQPRQVEREDHQERQPRPKPEARETRKDDKDKK